ncbi:MAG: hypothetical protein MUO78_09560, partial [candidate division Zixibacteria bacterium]|nr:hypothetical protein [candidate division Zixibacteria bacterium]
MSEIKMKSSTFVLLFVVIVLLVLIFNTTFRFVSFERVCPDNRVVDGDNPFTLHQPFHRIQFNLDPEMADPLF